MCHALQQVAITPTLSLQELLLASDRLLQLATGAGRFATRSELHCTRALILGRSGRHGEALEEAERALAVGLGWPMSRLAHCYSAAPRPAVSTNGTRLAN
jgi:hypothetical protein